MTRVISLLLGLLTYTTPASAITPPNNQPLCNIGGKILALTSEEIQGSTVPMIIVEIDSITANDKNNTHFCIMPMPVEDRKFSGKRNAGYYRLCQEKLPPLNIGQEIKAVVGRSLGAGRYCIENIELPDE